MKRYRILFFDLDCKLDKYGKKIPCSKVECNESELISILKNNVDPERETKIIELVGEIK